MLPQEELNEDGKAAAVAALGAWLPKCAPGPVPDAAAARFEAGLKEKESLRRAHLRALVAALRGSPDARGQVRGGEAEGYDRGCSCKAGSD